MPSAEGDGAVYGRPENTAGTRLLRVRVVRAVDLIKKDVFGLSDPYSMVTLQKGGRSTRTYGQAAKTKTVRHSLNPVWNEQFVFRAAHDNRIVLAVYDENRVTRDDFLGMVEIDLSAGWIRAESAGAPIGEKQYLLRPRTARSRVRGTLRVALSWLPANEGEEGSGGGALPVPHGRSQSEAERGSWELFPSSVTSGSLHTSRSGSTTSIDAQSTTTATGERNGSPLPTGWEMRVDANGRTFYVNHNGRTTQWDRPTHRSMTPETQAANLGELARRRDDFERRWRTSAEDSQQAASEQRDMAVRGELGDLDSAMSRAYFGESADASAGVGEVASMLDAAGDGLGAIPDGWEMQVAPNGRKFFINHQTRTTSWVDPRSGKPTEVPGAKPAAGQQRRAQLADDLGPLPAGWEERRHTDGRIFFIDHNTRSTQWDDPRFLNETIAGPAVPYSRDYKRKYEYFRSHLPPAPGGGDRSKKFVMHVRREHVLEDSYRSIMAVKHDAAAALHNKLWIEFDGELGYDYGGIAREWFFLLSHELFNPYYGLFEYSATDNYTLQINPHSAVCNEEHLSYYRFVGRVMGIAMYHGKLLDAFFIRPFYKMLLGKPIVLQDMESVDNEYYNSLVWIADNDPECLALTFTIDEDVFGSTVSRDLKPGGGDIAVTEENKHEYIQLIIKWRFVSRVGDQMSALTAGIKELIPGQLLSIFDANELELLLCGLQKIDVKDWKDHTVYKSGYGPSHPVIQNFWKCVLSFDNETRCRLLQFATGTSRVPMNGFGELYGSNGPQRFTVEKWGGPDMLPRAHTCFNRIDLPPYESYEAMKARLVTAIENAEIFSGVD